MAKTAEYNYQTDNGHLFKVRMDSDAVLDTIRGLPPAGVLTENMLCRISKNDNEAGISPRHVLFGRIIGTEDPATIGLTDTGVRYKKVPLLTPAAIANIVTGKLGDPNVTNFVQNGATYYALRVKSEDIN